MSYEWLKNIALEARATAERERVRAEEAVRMIHADRMASVGQLAAGVAHEINNPLAYIAGNLEFVARELGSSKPGARGELLDALSEARQGIERVALIVRGLKTFARDDDEELSPVDLCQAMATAVRIVENELRHRAQLELEIPSSPVWVRGNDARLVQVFLNLLLNAAQAIPPGRTQENTVRVVVEASGGFGLARVEDTGSGMSDAVLARATEPFFTTKPIGIGTGLGLSVCANVVRGVGGDFHIASKEGHGTTIHISIPSCDAPAAEIAAVPAEPADERPPRRLLLVDDDPLVARALVRLLRGHAVTAVSNGRDAITLLEQGTSYDIILCDIMMPELTGADVYEKIAAMGRGLERNIVFLTGGVFSNQLRSFLESVPNPRYSKPIRANEVAEILRWSPKSDVVRNQAET